MSLLAPLYLLGAAAIIIPILLHRRRQRPDTTSLFSTLLFLEPTPPKVKTKTKIENLLLLLLRCLALILIALCFGRPLLPSLSEEPTSIKRQVILIDTSASTQREEVHEQLIQKVNEFLKNLPENQSQVALMTFNREATVLYDFTRQTDQLDLQPVVPTWYGTNLGNALLSASQHIQQTPKPTDLPMDADSTIHVFSDLQKGADLTALTENPWPTNIEVVLHTVAPQQNPGQNAAIHPAPAHPDKPTQARIRVSNPTTAANTTFTVRWNSEQTDTETTKTVLQIEPGQTRILSAPQKPDATATTLQLAGDPHEFDNALHIAPAPARPLNILHLQPEADDTPQGTYYYLNKALQPTKFLHPTVLSQTPDSVPSEPDFTPNHLVVVETPISETLKSPIQAYLETGRSLLILLKHADHLPELASFLELPEPTQIPTVAEKDYHLFGNLDTSHPVLSPFHDPRFRDFSKLHVWQHRPWMKNAEAGKILASFDDGEPALIHMPHEKGNSLVLTTSWAPKDSQLALSTKFIPLLYSILEFSIGNLQPQTNYTTDLPIDLSQFPAVTSIQSPDGETHTIEENQTHFQPTQPGIHKLLTEQHTHLLAINLPPKESETTPMEESTLLSLTNSKTSEEPQDQLASNTLVHIESTQKLWRWILIAALVILAFETWLASRLTRTA